MNPSGRSGLQRWWPVLLLSLLYVVSLIDRLILTLLVDPLKADLGISDTQVAMLVGSSFAFFYAGVGFPAAWALDRGRRLLLGITGVVLWSVATLASGFVDSFAWLLTLRVGVAIGEAVLSPLAISLIADLFPRAQRSLPLSIFIASGTLGIFAAYSFGGWMVGQLEQGSLAGVPLIGDLAPWRAAMVLAGLPGLGIALVMALTVRDPPRVKDTPPTDSLAATRVGAFANKGDAIRFYTCFFLGCGLVSMPSQAALAWFPTFLVRRFGISPADSGYVFSLAMLAAALTLLSLPFVMRLLARRGFAAPLVPIALVITPLGMGLFALALSQESLAATVPWMVLGYGLLAGGINTLPQMVVGLTAPAAYRGRLVAIGLAGLTVIGMGIGPFATAWLGENVFSGPAALGHALLALVAVTGPLAWGLIFFSWQPFRRALQH